MECSKVKRTFKVHLKLNDKVCANCYHAHHDVPNNQWQCIKFRYPHWSDIYDIYTTECKYFKPMQGVDISYSKGGKQHVNR